MFAARYFNGRSFAPRYFPKVGATVTVTRFVQLTLGPRSVYTLAARPTYALAGRPTLTVEEE